MKKQNKRLVAQPKGEGKCHSLTPNANLATVAPRARVGDASFKQPEKFQHLDVAPRARVGDASKKRDFKCGSCKWWTAPEKTLRETPNGYCECKKLHESKVKISKSWPNTSRNFECNAHERRK